MAILDVFRRMAGMETADEAKAAEAVARKELLDRDYADPVKSFAANAAAALRTASDEVLRQKLPDVSLIGNGRIPRDGDRRQLHVAKAAEAYGERYLSAGGDHGLDPPLGEAVRQRTLVTVNMRDLANPESPSLSARVKARAAAAALATETYVGVGSTHERAISMAAMGAEHSVNAKPLDPRRRAAAEQAIGPLDAERFAHTGPIGYEPAGSAVSIRRAVMAYEVAQARAGVVAPGRIVGRADAVEMGELLRGVAQSPRPGETMEHVRPDFRHVGMDPRSPRYAEIVTGQFREAGKELGNDRALPPPEAKTLQGPPKDGPGHAIQAIALQNVGRGM